VDKGEGESHGGKRKVLSGSRVKGRRGMISGVGGEKKVKR